MNTLLVAIRIHEPDPAFDAEIAATKPPRSFGLLLCRHRLARERLKRTGFVG